MSDKMSRGDRDETLGDVLEMLRWEDDGGQNVGRDDAWLSMTDRNQRSRKISHPEVTKSEPHPPQCNPPQPN